MSSTGKIVGLLALIGGAYGLSRLIRTGSKLSINVANVNRPDAKSGALVLSVNVTIDNPTGKTISIKKPYLVARHNGKEVGNSIPSDEHIDIAANDRTTIKGINIHIPFVKAGATLWSLITGNAKAAFDIDVQTVADGIPYTNSQHFEV